MRRELHDDINQRLALLAISLERLQQNPPSSAELMREIGEARKELENLGSDVQALSHHLHSSKLEYLGLAVAAAGFCREVSSQRGVEIDFHSENIPRDLPKEIELSLFRVLQEAIQNAAKHSGSRHFEVSLRGGSSEIELTVRDSGIGFDPARGYERAWARSYQHQGTPETRERESFHRLAAATRNNDPGSRSSHHQNKVCRSSWIEYLLVRATRIASTPD